MKINFKRKNHYVKHTDLKMGQTFYSQNRFKHYIVIVINCQKRAVDLETGCNYRLEEFESMKESIILTDIECNITEANYA